MNRTRSMLDKRFLASFLLQLFITLVICLQPEPALAVGTWGGADPPSADDGAGSLPWWWIPLAFAFFALQFYLGGRMFALVGVFLVGTIVAGWLGSTAGWVAALAFAAWLYKTFYATDEKQDQRVERMANSHQQQDESPQPREEPVLHSQKIHIESSKLPSVEASATSRRISELRERIDKEAARNDRADNLMRSNDCGSESRRRLK